MASSIKRQISPVGSNDSQQERPTKIPRHDTPLPHVCDRCSELDIPNVLDDVRVRGSTRDFSNVAIQRIVFDSTSDGLCCGVNSDLRRVIFGHKTRLLPTTLYRRDLTESDAEKELSRCHLWMGYQEERQPVLYDGNSKPTATFGRETPLGDPGAVQMVGRRPDYAAISAWLNCCLRGVDSDHSMCANEYSPTLQRIFLIDVRTEELVPYPGSMAKPTEYLALSYVWGECQKIDSQVLGPLSEKIESTRKTIFDSIAVTKHLNVRYLWVDAICINQDDETLKKEQLGYMADIYRGALASIISLSGESANDGLPGVSNHPRTHHQRRIGFGESNTMLEKTPTAATQIQLSKWATRGWTFQEGLLSRRRILFTSHEALYFCATMRCCESLDDANFFGPKSGSISDEEDPIFVFAPHALDEDSRQIEADLEPGELYRYYARLVNKYCFRELGLQQDALRAFSGMLQDLKRHQFPKGFWQGLPIVDFPRSLLWSQNRDKAQGAYKKLSDTTRRESPIALPSWSWAAWHLVSELEFPLADHVAFDECPLPKNLEPPLCIRTGFGTCLYDNSGESWKVWRIRGYNPPRRKMLGLPRTEPEEAGYENINEDEEDGIELQIEGLVFQFRCKLSLSNSWRTSGTDGSEPDRQLSFETFHDDGTHKTHFTEDWRIDGKNKRLFDETSAGRCHNLLLLNACIAEERNTWILRLHFLLLYVDGNKAVRSGVVYVSGDFFWMSETFWTAGRPSMKYIRLL